MKLVALIILSLLGGCAGPYSVVPKTGRAAIHIPLCSSDSKNGSCMKVINISYYAVAAEPRERFRDVPSVVYLRPGRFLVFVSECRDANGEGYVSLGGITPSEILVRDASSYQLVCSGNLGGGVSLERLSDANNS
ncbi:MAG: hypothetical protein AAGB19_10105 [Cyanobacteria bacterium P01_F01_bin.3]